MIPNYMRPLFIVFVILATVPPIVGEETFFQSAVPVWPEGRDAEMNCFAGFRAEFESAGTEREPVTLRVAAATIYRAWVNGQFVGHGPARAGHEYYRVDVWDITKHLKPGKNLVAIEVAGYNANSYYLLDQPSFVQAEVRRGDVVLAATGFPEAPFDAAVLDYRVQKVRRFSFQRPFIEVYRMTPDSQTWRSDPAAAFEKVALVQTDGKRLLARGVGVPEFAQVAPIRSVASGKLVPQAVATYWKDRSMTNVGDKLKGFPEEELAAKPSQEAQEFVSEPETTEETAYDPQTPFALSTREYRILDLGTNLTGFLGATVTCSEKTKLWFLFDELLTDGDVKFNRLGCACVVSFELEPGTYHLESIEPYTLRYWKIACVEGKCEIHDAYLREYTHPGMPATFASSNPRLDKLFRAGVETFRQNTLDVFMDCPSRERAGWLCDSFFTARVERDLTGTSRVERAFYENFLLPEKFECLPEGMLPMCYPADHYDGVFIPNWAMWFVVQLEEYAARSGDREMVEALEPKVMKLLEYFKPFENEDGLLEKLESWVFVEWSPANQFVQDVNYPSNMLYAGVLSAAGRLYDRPELLEKAEKLRETIRKQSFDGTFFVDNAVRKDGKLEVTTNRSEVCQYFAFFFDVASFETHPELWQKLREAFGPDRKETKAFSEVHLANSFIGNMLRMELLSQRGQSQQILDESIGYLEYMADRTGTLWENVHADASCNHGFASHICHTLFRDVLGVREVDIRNKTVRIRFGKLDLESCRGEIPTPEGPISLSWRRDGEKIEYDLQMPEGYKAEIRNDSGLGLVDHGGVRAARKKTAAKPRRIIMNNDGNDTRPDDARTRENFLKPRMAALAGTQVDAVFYCDGVWGLFSHHSEVSEVRKHRDRYGVDWAWELAKDGPDSLATVVDFGHENGMEVFWSMRMNDTHDSGDPALFRQWKQDHPQCLMGKKGDRFKAGGNRWSAVNYECPEVREQVYRFFEDVASRYDVDGLELDFFRHPVFFKPQMHGEPVTGRQCELMTGLLRRIRAMADRRAAERGRPILIAVRVPDSLGFSKAIGLDIERWMAEDLIDIATMSGYFRLCPWEESVALGRKYGVRIFAGLSESRLKDADAVRKRRTDECYRGRAMNAWAAGVDGIYLFNYFNPEAGVFRELGDPVALETMNKVYTTGARTVGAANSWLVGSAKYRNRPIPLPEKPLALDPKKAVTVELRVGEDMAKRIAGGKTPKVRLVLILSPAKDAPLASVAARINANDLKDAVSSEGEIVFPVDPPLVRRGANHFEVIGPKGAKLRDLLLYVAY